MKRLITAACLTLTLISGTAMAKPSKNPAVRAKIRRQMIQDLRQRGSAIPPAVSGESRWTR